MHTRWPRIRERRVTRVSPWVELVEREVEFSPEAPAQIYHALQLADYVAIVARTPEGLFPIVRQFRPAIEDFSWELPAGMIDADESASECCARELMEETGYPAVAVHALGVAVPCTARLPNRQHSFFVRTGERAADFTPEPGMEVKLVSLSELARLIMDGRFNSQLHLGTLLQAGLHGHLDLAALTAGAQRG